MPMKQMRGADVRTAYVPGGMAARFGIGAFTDENKNALTGNMMMPEGENVGLTKNDKSMLQTVSGAATNLQQPLNEPAEQESNR